MSQQHTPPNINLDPGAPFSQEAEEAVIGSILIEPTIYYAVASFLKADDFFLLRHKTIWKSLVRLVERSEPIDHITLAEELENMKVLDEIGGRAYLIQLANNTGTSMYAEVYGRLVERTSIRRKLMIAADDIKKLAMDEALNIDTVVSDAEAKIFSATESSSSGKDPVPLWDALSDYYDKLEYQLQHHETVGVPTGFRDVDAILTGMHKKTLTYFAGRPSMGKSSYLLGMAVNAARLGARVAFFSIEMRQEELIQRMVSMETGINTQKLKLAKLTPQEAARFTECVGRISNLQLFIDEHSSLNPAQLRAKVQRLKHRYGLDLVIIDYLQLMNDPNHPNNRYQEISSISRSLKQLAKDMNIPVVAASQLSRALEKRQNKRPILSDLRESGQLEQDADVIKFIYRDEIYNPATEFPNQAEIIIAKHRNGPTGTVSLYFEKQLTKFMDASTHRVDLSDLG